MRKVVAAYKEQFQEKEFRTGRLTNLYAQVNSFLKCVSFSVSKVTVTLVCTESMFIENLISDLYFCLFYKVKLIAKL